MGNFNIGPLNKQENLMNEEQFVPSTLLVATEESPEDIPGLSDVTVALTAAVNASKGLKYFAPRLFVRYEFGLYRNYLSPYNKLIN